MALELKKLLDPHFTESETSIIPTGSRLMCREGDEIFETEVTDGSSCENVMNVFRQKSGLLSLLHITRNEVVVLTRRHNQKPCACTFRDVLESSMKKQEDRELKRAVEAYGKTQHMIKKNGSENDPELTQAEWGRVSERLSTGRTAKECCSRQEDSSFSPIIPPCCSQLLKKKKTEIKHGLCVFSASHVVLIMYIYFFFLVRC